MSLSLSLSHVSRSQSHVTFHLADSDSSPDPVLLYVVLHRHFTRGGFLYWCINQGFRRLRFSCLDLVTFPILQCLFQHLALLELQLLHPLPFSHLHCFHLQFHSQCYRSGSCIRCCVEDPRDLPQERKCNEDTKASSTSVSAMVTYILLSCGPAHSATAAKHHPLLTAIPFPILFLLWEPRPYGKPFRSVHFSNDHHDSSGNLLAPASRRMPSEVTSISAAVR